MKSVQHKRKESLLFHEVASILSEQISNTNISSITVTGVNLSKDQAFLKIFVIFKSHKHKSFQYLQHTKGFVRSQIARLKNLRIVPEIIFKLDETAEKAQRIEQILASIKQQD